MVNCDIFISFKHHDKNENVTLDFNMASELKEALNSLGVKTFFSHTSLKENGASNYKREIDEALDSAKILVVVGTSVENINSDWVRYEWDGFVNDIISGIKPEAKVYFLIDNISVSEMPRSLRQVQGFQYKENGINELVEHIKNSLGVTQNHSVSEQVNDKRQSSYSYTDAGEKQRLEYQAILESKRDGEILQELCNRLPDERVNVLDLGC